jgi:hypothetical protein
MNYKCQENQEKEKEKKRPNLLCLPTDVPSKSNLMRQLNVRTIAWNIKASNIRARSILPGTDLAASYTSSATGLTPTQPNHRVPSREKQFRPICSARHRRQNLIKVIGRYDLDYIVIAAKALYHIPKDNRRVGRRAVEEGKTVKVVDLERRARSGEVLNEPSGKAVVWVGDIY